MSVIVEIKVIPNSNSSGIYIDKSDKLCVRLTSVPENGKANQELINVIAKKLEISRSNVEIVWGMKSKSKRLRITDNFLNKEDVINKLVPIRQQSLF